MSHDVDRELFRGAKLYLSMHGYPILDLFPGAWADVGSANPAEIEPGDMMLQLDVVDVRWLRDQLDSWLKEHA